MIVEKKNFLRKKNTFVLVCSPSYMYTHEKVFLIEQQSVKMC